jgi:hypothetical protein
VLIGLGLTLPKPLITTLANAVDTARDQRRDIGLPELSVEPIASAQRSSR